MKEGTRRRLLRGVLLGTLLVGLAMLVARPLVQWRLRLHLQQLGFQDPALRVRGLSLHRLLVRDLHTAGPVVVQVERAHATYSPGLLRRGQVDAIAIQGAVVQPAAGLDWPAALAALRLGPSTGQPPPLRSVTLSDGVLVLGPDLMAAIGTARLDAQPDGMPFSMAVQLNGTALTAAGRYEPEQRAIDAHVAAPVVDLVRWVSILTNRLARGELQLTGAPAFGVDVKASPGRLAATIAVSNATSCVTFASLPTICLTSVTASVNLADDDLRFAIAVPLMEGLVLNAAGGCSSNRGFAVESMRLAGPPISDPTALSRCLPMFEGLRFTGQPEITDGYWRAGGGVVDFACDAAFHDLALGSQAWDLEVQGVNGPLKLRLAEDRITQGEQVLTIDSLRVGKLRLTDGRVRYAVQRDGVLAIGASEFAWGGGVLRVGDALIDPVAGVAYVQWEMAHVELGALLALLAAGRATGEGTLSGAWSLTARWKPQLSLEFGSGQLVADPGGGWFRVAQPEDAARLIGDLGRDRETVGAAKALVEKIQRAMLDFEFDEFAVTFSPTNGVLRTQIQTKGRGPRGKDALPFGGLVFNINGLDDLLQFVLVRPRGPDAKSEAKASETRFYDRSE